MKKRGFSLIEILVVLALFSGVMAIALSILSAHDRVWRIGESERIEQQEARRAMSEITSLLRQSNPDWDIGGVHYPVTITAGNRIDFYQPIFDNAGNITTLRKITFRPDTNTPTQLLKKEGLADPTIIAHDVESLSFGGSCAGCLAFNCAAVAPECPTVEVAIQTRRDAGINLTSRVTLRNNYIIPTVPPVIEEPAEGEF